MICDCCGVELDSEPHYYINGRCLCWDCFDDYSKSAEAMEGKADFIRSHKKEFLTHWFSGDEDPLTMYKYLGDNVFISEKTKLDLLWHLYQIWKSTVPGRADAVELEFVSRFDDLWKEFLLEGF